MRAATPAAALAWSEGNPYERLRRALMSISCQKSVHKMRHRGFLVTHMGFVAPPGKVITREYPVTVCTDGSILVQNDSIGHQGRWVVEVTYFDNCLVLVRFWRTPS